VDTLADYTVTGDTRLDTSGFTKGISSMTVAAGNLISGLVSTATSKMAGLAKSSVSVGMSFEASMSQVAATMGKSTEEIESLTKVAKEMGSSTKFSATQAADALNYLALAGYDADKAAEVLPSVLNLAAAGGMDLAYASDLVTDAMASLNIEANKNNVDDFGNKLAMAASKANANVSQLGEAILTVGGTAANLKNGTTELTTALGLLANVGIKGAEGGTHLRNIILSLQSPTDDAAKLIQQLGLQVYNAQGNMRGLDEILGDLNTRMVDMTQGQKDSIINRLFNKTDLAAVNGLLAAQGEQWDALAAQIDAAGGAMEQMAETQQDNLQGVMTSMSSAFEGLQLAVYERLEPALTDAGSWGVECIRSLTDALSNGGPEAMLSAAGGILSDLAAGIVEQLPGMVSAGVNIIAYLAQSLVAATPEMLTTGASIVGALVDSLSSALPQLLDTGIEMLSQLGAGLVQGIPELLTQALPLVADLASGLRENAGKLVDAGLELIFNLMQGLMDGLPTLIEYLPGIVSDLAGIINDNAPKLLAAGAHLIVMLGEGLLEALPTIIENIPQICKAIFDVFTAFRWLDIGSQIVTGLWNGLKSGWTGLISKVQGLAQQLPDIVKKVLGIHSPSRVFSEIGMQTCAGLAQGMTLGNAKVKKAASEVLASVTETATQITDGVTRTVETTTQWMADGATKQAQTITSTSRQMVDGVLKDIKTVETIAADGKRTVSQTMETVRDVVDTVTASNTAIVDGIKTTTQTVTKTLADGTTEQQQVITQTQDKVIDGALRTVETVKTIAADGTEQVAETIKDSAAKTLDGLWSELKDRANEGILGTVGTLWDAVKSGDWLSIGKWAASALYSGLTADQKQKLTDYALSLVDGLNGVLGDAAGSLAQAAWGIGQSLFEGITGKFGDISSMAVQMGGTLKSVFGALKTPLAAAAKAISTGLSGGLMSMFPAIYAGFAGMIGTIGAAVQGMLAAVSAALSSTLFGIPAGLVVAAAAVALGVAIAAIVSKLGGSHSSSGGSGGSGGGGGGSSGLGIDTPSITDESNKLTDTIDANTAKLTEINKSLAKLVKSANALVLSDNMAVSSRVAASGTAQIAAAARSYREGDTNITQNIYSKAHTAADLQREARWEADRAKAEKH
jgi:TP901 family phage tail tape measure protein